MIEVSDETIDALIQKLEQQIVELSDAINLLLTLRGERESDMSVEEMQRYYQVLLD